MASWSELRVLAYQATRFNPEIGGIYLHAANVRKDLIVGTICVVLGHALAAWGASWSTILATLLFIVPAYLLFVQYQRAKMMLQLAIGQIPPNM